MYFSLAPDGPSFGVCRRYSQPTSWLGESGRKVGRAVVFLVKWGYLDSEMLNTGFP